MTTPQFAPQPEQAVTPAQTPDLTDEVGMLLAVAPKALTAAKARELLMAASRSEKTQIITILHTLKGNRFVQEVLSAMPEADRATVTADNGVDETNAYLAHPNLAFAAPGTTRGENGKLAFTDTPEQAQANADANQQALDGSNTADRIAALERLQGTLPKGKTAIALNAAITTQLTDLKHDRNLLDANAATVPWIGQDRSEDLKQVRKDLYPERKATDCTVFVIDTFKAAMAAAGLGAQGTQVMQEAHAGAARNKAGKEIFSGVDIQRAMATKLGWDNIYVDTSGDRSPLRKGVTPGSQKFYSAPVAGSVVGQAQFDTLLAELAEIEFAIITVNEGGHMKLLARGMIYECHWSEQGPYLFEATPLAAESFGRALFTGPPGTAAKLAAFAP